MSTRRIKGDLDDLRAFEKRMGCEDRYLTGATGKEPLAQCFDCEGTGWLRFPKRESAKCGRCEGTGFARPLPCTSLEGAALMATRGELEEVRDRLDGLSRPRALP